MHPGRDGGQHARQPWRGPGRRGVQQFVGFGDHPGVLGATALAAVDHQRPLRQRHAGQTARQHEDVLAVIDGEGPQIDVARGQLPVLDQRRAGGDLHDPLCDPAARILEHLRSQLGQLLIAGLVADHQAIAAGSIDRLEHHAVQAVDDKLALFGILQVVGVDVGQDRALPEVVLDQGRNVGVDRLVIGHPVAHGVGDGDPARARSVQQPRNPEHRVRAKVHGIEVVVVETAVQDVDGTRTTHCAHPDLIVAAVEVAPLDEFHTHPPSQEGVLEMR